MNSFMQVVQKALASSDRDATTKYMTTMTVTDPLRQLFEVELSDLHVSTIHRHHTHRMNGVNFFE